MKTTLTFETVSEEKLNLLIRIAAEMGITVMPDKQEIKSYIEDDSISIVSEPALGEAWDSPEDDRWDELYKK